MSLLEVGDRSLPRGRGSFWLSKCDRRIHLVLSIGDGVSGCGSCGSVWSVFCLLPSVISIVDVTLCFLTALLFSVDCSYLKQWPLPFVPPIFLFSPPKCGRVRRKVREQESISGLGSLSRGTELRSTVPKPQQYNSFQYCEILIAVKYLHDDWILKICSKQDKKIILNSSVDLPLSLVICVDRNLNVHNITIYLTSYSRNSERKTVKVSREM